MNTNNEFLTKKIMTYLGNKRTLLSFINNEVKDLINSDDELKNKEKSKIEILDIFSGTGIVSRSLKKEGFKVMSNDLELYTIAINKAFIGTNKSDLNTIFKGIPENLFRFYKLNNIKIALKSVDTYKEYREVDQLDLITIKDAYELNKLIKEKGEYFTTLALLNNVRSLNSYKLKNNTYFQNTYAPKDTLNPNFDSERLFFTQENAQFIDAILDALFSFEINEKKVFGEHELGDLEQLGSDKEERCKQTKPNQFNKKVTAIDIILAELFSEMTVRINTSGIMKAFHNGWGGSGRAAIKRIMGHIALTGLPLIDTTTDNKEASRGEVYNDFAELLFKKGRNGLEKRMVDVVYADPPYNQHQYSSNYHLLTTATRNRDYEAGAVGKGTRSGIRKTHTRSDFCKRLAKKSEVFEGKVSGALLAFDEFVKNIQNHTKYLLVSYNQTGVLSQSELISVLSQNGKNTVDFVTKKHERYNGGQKGSISNSAIEYLFKVKTNTKQNILELNKLKVRLEKETGTLLQSVDSNEQKLQPREKIAYSPVCSMNSNLNNNVIGLDDFKTKKIKKEKKNSDNLIDLQVDKLDKTLLSAAMDKPSSIYLARDKHFLNTLKISTG